MATLIPTGGVISTDIYAVDRRFNPAMFYPSFHSGGHFAAAVIQRRPAPTTPQFSGTVDPNDAQSVELVNRADGSMMERTAVDPANGTFSFRGWYDPTTADYGFRFLAPDGFCSQTFPVDAPEWNQFMGNPELINSNTGARP